MTDTGPAAVIVLAAGDGTRMRSRTPKVLHRIGGRTLLSRALEAAAGVDPQHLVVVVGGDRDEVGAHARAEQPGARVVVQEQQFGTGHATACAMSALPGLTGTIVVTYGDTPLLAAQTLRDLVQAHERAQGAVTVLTAVVDDPTGYGRVVRDRSGAVVAIVEERDADDAHKAIREINSGIYVFEARLLADGLRRLSPDNAQDELYLTDVVGQASAGGHRVAALQTADAWQTEGVNDRAQLARLGAELNRRTLHRHLLAGVTVVDPATTWVDDGVRLEPDVVLLPGVQLHGATEVAAGAVIGPDCTLTDVEVGAGAEVVRTHGSDAVVEAGASVGPFAYLRPGTRLGPGGKIGAFVETKNAEIGAAAKVPHLSYVGDAEVGTGTNIGAGTIVANYDGVAKHRTVVGAHCRTGANNTFVAPVEIGDGAVTGGGTVVRRDVPAGALAVSTGTQRNLEGWTLRKRPGTPAAEAAARAGKDGDALSEEETPA